jgi:hypothetical protein
VKREEEDETGKGERKKEKKSRPVSGDVNEVGDRA